MTLVQLDRAVEIERLAALDTFDYEIARKEAADRLGIRASVLDDLRIQKRRELKLDTDKTDDGQGRAVTSKTFFLGPMPLRVIALLPAWRRRSSAMLFCLIPQPMRLRCGSCILGFSIGSRLPPTRNHLPDKGLWQCAKQDAT
jgi:hypothetical protein